jgi:hypothetical protein
MKDKRSRERSRKKILEELIVRSYGDIKNGGEEGGVAEVVTVNTCIPVQQEERRRI